MSEELSSLLQSNPQSVYEWIHRAWDAEADTVKAKFNWGGLAEVAVRRAFPEDGAPPDLEWARIAIEVNEYLSKRYMFSIDSFMISAMFVRARLIIALGNRAGDPLLDIDHITAWFYENLPMSRQDVLEQVNQGIRHILSSDLDLVTKLRDIKNRLKPLKILNEQGYFEADAEIKAWIELWDKLP